MKQQSLEQNDKWKLQQKTCIWILRTGISRNIICSVFILLTKVIIRLFLINLRDNCSLYSSCVFAHGRRCRNTIGLTCGTVVDNIGVKHGA